MIICEKGRRCNRPRQCDYCAAVRQMQAANRAESCAKSATTWITIDQDKKAHDKILRNTKGGMWSLEEAPYMGRLHVNYLVDEVITKDDVYTLIGDCVAIAHIEKPKNIRHVAAYITKKSQLPKEVVRSLGYWGNWKRIDTVIMKNEKLPITALLQLEEALKQEIKKNDADIEDVLAALQVHCPIVMAVAKNLAMSNMGEIMTTRGLNFNLFR